MTMENVSGDGATSWHADTDQDGTNDAMAFDRDGDGLADAFVFDDQTDGRFAAIDTDGDHVLDAELLDIDGDGRFDGALVDTDGDGTFETPLARNDDGSFRAIELTEPTDATGPKQDAPSTPMQQPVTPRTDDTVPTTDTTTDTTKDTSTDTPTDTPTDTSAPDHDQTQVQLPTADPTPDPSTPETPTNEQPVDTMAGDPEGDAGRWFYQVDNGLCMPASVTQIVVEMTNGQHSFEEVQQVAIANNWLSKGPNETFMTDKGYGWSGMYTEDGVKLLESFGIDAEQVAGMTPETLAQLLDRGFDVIATVDGDEIWTGQDDDATDGGKDSNHALVITGIDEARGVVILNDPGDPDGRAHEYSLNTFLDAWGDGGNEAIIASPPAGAIVGATQYGDIDLVSPQSPGVVVLPVVLDHRSFLDPDKWR